MTTEEETKYYIALYGYVPWTISIAFSLENGMEWDSAEIAKQLRMAQAKIDELTLRINEKNTWVGLTDEERHDIREWQRIQEELGPVWSPMMLYLYEAIEAKLREKNT